MFICFCKSKITDSFFLVDFVYFKLLSFFWKKKELRIPARDEKQGNTPQQNIPFLENTSLLPTSVTVTLKDSKYEGAFQCQHAWPFLFCFVCCLSFQQHSDQHVRQTQEFELLWQLFASLLGTCLQFCFEQESRLSAVMELDQAHKHIPQPGKPVFEWNPVFFLLQSSFLYSLLFFCKNKGTESLLWRPWRKSPVSVGNISEG